MTDNGFRGRIAMWRIRNAWKLICSIVIMIFSATLCCAEESNIKESNFFTYRLKGNGTVSIVSFNWAANGENDIYVPLQIDGYPVTEIGDFAFSKDITFSPGSLGEKVVVVLPHTITSIGKKAFYCTKISSVTIPEGVQSIGIGAFAGCSNILNFYVEEGNHVYTTVSGVLYNKIQKELVAWPLGTEAKFIVPDGIISIGDFAYAGCEFKDIHWDTGLNSSTLFPPSVKRIGNYSFYQTKITRNTNRSTQRDLKRTSILDLYNVSEIGDYAFFEAELCSSTYNNYLGVYGSNVKKIGDYAFANMIFPFYDSEEQSSSAYYDKYLDFYDRGERWIFPFENITEIGNYAFLNTTFKMEAGDGRTLLFPSTLESIGIGAFETLKASLPRSAKGYSHALILDFSDSKVSMIPQYAFSECNNIDSVTMPKGTKTIEDYAFYKLKNKSMKPIIIPESVETIGSYAFAEGQGGSMSKKESALKTIGDYAFYNAKNIIEPLDGLQAIGSRTFMVDRAIELSIPSSVDRIGEEFCDRTRTILHVIPGSYGERYAKENGYQTDKKEDLSWLE